MSQDIFQTIWDLHIKWSRRILFRETIQLPTAQVFLSDIPTNYMNFAFPVVDLPEKLNLES